jgi:hypothetical protein
MEKRIVEWMVELRPHFLFWIIGSIAGAIYDKFHSVPPVVFYSFSAGVLLTAVVSLGTHVFPASRHPPAPVTNRPPTTVARVAPAIRILHKNAAMHLDVGEVLSLNSAKIQRVLVIQYSGRNIKDVIDEIWFKTSANIEL